jgi:hypothetical protein
MRLVNEPVSAEIHVSADGTLQPAAFTWQGRRYEATNQGRAWIEDGVRCFLVMTIAQEIFELHLLTDGRWILARALERPHLA